jgi:hypothetical protein
MDSTASHCRPIATDLSEVRPDEIKCEAKTTGDLHVFDELLKRSKGGSLYADVSLLDDKSRRRIRDLEEGNLELERFWFIAAESYRLYATNYETKL